MKSLEKIFELKIVSLIVFVVFGILSYEFLKSSPAISTTRGTFGVIFATTSIVSGIYILINYLISENYKKIIDFQYLAMENISKTHTSIEDTNQNTLAKTQPMIGGDKYIPVLPEDQDLTKTN